MDAEQTIADIERLERIFAAPDTRPLNPGDLAAVNRRHDEMLAQSPWFRLWQRYGFAAEVSPQSFNWAKQRANLRKRSMAQIPPWGGVGITMTDEVLFHQGTTMVRRLCLAPGETMPWHRDPFHRVAVVLGGDVLLIEYRDGGDGHRVKISPGQVDWEKPSERIHRAVNVGKESYEQVTVFLLDRPDAVPQPGEEA